MTRLDGEKKSPLPWIIGLLVLALLAAAIYYFAFAKGNDNADNSVEITSNAPAGMGADSNIADANMADANMADANSMDANMADTNAMDANMVDTNSMDANSAMMNGADSNMATGNMADSNALGSDGTMMSNSATSDNSAAAMPLPAMTPASSDAKSKSDDVVATRSKTIKTDDKTVIYQKSVKADGTVMRDKKIVGKPVESAKQ